MAIKIALAGNPNCGKTTLFNALTGSTQYVGNWPGVTVEKKEGRLRGHKDVMVEDLPGIYSLSPYSAEEVVSRKYLVEEKPDVILNIVDGTNLERNLYLTTQLLEVGLPVVLAVNMMDLVKKNGDRMDLNKLSRRLNCPVVEMSALKGQGSRAAVDKCLEVAANANKSAAVSRLQIYGGAVKTALDGIERLLPTGTMNRDWYAVKLFERDMAAVAELKLSEQTLAEAERLTAACEKAEDDDAESIITNARYTYIQDVVAEAVKKGRQKNALTTSDKIDRVVTNRFLAIPIFVVLIWFVYALACGSFPWSIGQIATDWTNDVLFGEWIMNGATAGLEAIGAADWVKSFVVDGLINGVGTVLGFIPQMAVLFLGVSILEDSGYMARVAFIMDRIFRKFGLSGKSFIPMLIGTGCGVPAIMAARTIEDDRDRKMTIMLSTFLPCGAKMDIVLLMSAIFFPRNSLVPTSMYFLGLAIAILSGIALKKTKPFAGEPAPFVMELPAYHVPSVRGVLIHVWDRVKHYAIKAGTIIFAVITVLWVLQYIGPSGFTSDPDTSFLRYIGEALAVLFRPLGFGTWQAAVASVSAELAKENATGTLGMLAHAASEEMGDMAPALMTMFGGSALAGLSFMLFNIFDAPCLVAIVAAFKEFNSRAWGWATFAFQMGVGYGLALMVYQIGTFVTTGTFTFWTVVAFALAIFCLYAIFRPAPKTKAVKTRPAVE